MTYNIHFPKNFLYVNVNFVWNQCANLKICTYVEWPVSLLFSFSVNVKRQCTHTSDTHSNARAHRQRKRDKRKNITSWSKIKVSKFTRSISNWVITYVEIPICQTSAICLVWLIYVHFVCMNVGSAVWKIPYNRGW